MLCDMYVCWVWIIIDIKHLFLTRLKFVYCADLKSVLFYQHKCLQVYIVYLADFSLLNREIVTSSIARQVDDSLFICRVAMLILSIGRQPNLLCVDMNIIL